jgi:hypothetical protein
MADEKHEKALDLTERALDKLDAGDEKSADRLLEEARKIDSTAPAEILKDIEEDAGKGPKS